MSRKKRDMFDRTHHPGTLYRSFQFSDMTGKSRALAWREAQDAFRRRKRARILQRLARRAQRGKRRRT